jgi:hypothetical protein
VPLVGKTVIDRKPERVAEIAVDPAFHSFSLKVSG